MLGIFVVILSSKVLPVNSKSPLYAVNERCKTMQCMHSLASLVALHSMHGNWEVTVVLIFSLFIAGGKCNDLRNASSRKLAHLALSCLLLISLSPSHQIEKFFLSSPFVCLLREYRHTKLGSESQVIEKRFWNVLLRVNKYDFIARQGLSEDAFFYKRIYGLV